MNENHASDNRHPLEHFLLNRLRFARNTTNAHDKYDDIFFYHVVPFKRETRSVERSYERAKTNDARLDLVDFRFFG